MYLKEIYCVNCLKLCVSVEEIFLGQRISFKNYEATKTNPQNIRQQKVEQKRCEQTDIHDTNLLSQQTRDKKYQMR